MFTVSQEC